MRGANKTLNWRIADALEHDPRFGAYEEVSLKGLWNRFGCIQGTWDPSDFTRNGAAAFALITEMMKQPKEIVDKFVKSFWAASETAKPISVIYSMLRKLSPAYIQRKAAEALELEDES